MKTIIIIPSRLSAVRLPGKPLLKINGLSIISHVFKKVVEANIGEVYVAAEDQEIIDDVHKNGGQAILTNNKHKTGTDRIFEALNKIESRGIEPLVGEHRGEQAEEGRRARRHDAEDAAQQARRQHARRVQQVQVAADAHPAQVSGDARPRRGGARLGFRQPVDQRALADVWPPHDAHPRQHLVRNLLLVRRVSIRRSTRLIRC